MVFKADVQVALLLAKREVLLTMQGQREDRGIVLENEGATVSLVWKGR